MIRGIVFDCFGVLYSGSLQYPYAMVSPQRREEIRSLQAEYDYGMISETDYFAGAAEITGHSIEEIHELYRQRHIRNDALFDFIKILKHDYKIGLLTNMGAGTLDALWSNEDLGLFDATLISSKEGMIKPNREAYELIAERLELPIDQCVMVDDLATNCEGAELAGMHAIQYVHIDLFRKHFAELLQQTS